MQPQRLPFDANRIRVSGGVASANGVTPTPLEVNSSGQLLVTAGFNLPQYDYYSVNYSGSTTDVVTYKTGGSGGITVATQTIVYVDSSKAKVSTVTWT